MSRSNSASTGGFRSLRSAIAIAVALSSFAMAPPSAQAVTYPSFVFSGAGTYHGVGMSQYGAKGYAERGKSGEWIVSHYFPGTTLSTVTGRVVKVNLDPTATSSSRYTASTWKVRAGWSGMAIALSAASGMASLPDTAGPYSFSVSSTKVAVADKDGKRVAGSPFSGTVTLAMRGSKAPALLQVIGRSGPFLTSKTSISASTDVRYRGTLLISSNGSKLKLVNSLDMESYLRGVVPRESPASWPLEALKAQALAARSYAYPDTGELYCDARSQMYNGYSHQTRGTEAAKMHEASRTNAAVTATANRYVAYQGKIVRTYFCASSGGYTAASKHVWGTDLAYLRGVPDPYGTGPYDPWASTVKVDGQQLALALARRISGEPAGAGTTVWVKGLDVTRTWPTGYASSADVRWSNGAVSRGLSANTVRWAVGLRSNKFFVNAVGDRIAGGSRYARSVAASKRAFPSATSAKCVIVANADGALFADAACGAALSGVAQGPLLLIKKNSIPSEVIAEIKRLRPAKVYIIGGTAVVSSTTASKLKSLVPSTKRLGGADRYATSAAVARQARTLGAASAKVVIASGTSWQDTTIAAALAGGSKRPLVLTGRSSLSPAAASVLREFRVTRSIVIGGPSSVQNSTLASVLGITKERTPWRRFGLTGSNYDLATAVASYGASSLAFSESTVYAASGLSSPDALIASALSSATKRPFVFTSTYTPPSATRAYLMRRRATVKKVTIVGHPATAGIAPGMQLMSDAY